MRIELSTFKRSSVVPTVKSGHIALYFTWWGNNRLSFAGVQLIRTTRTWKLLHHLGPFRFDLGWDWCP